MASYASYQQQPMGFNPHEFNFPPYTCDAEQSYLPTTTCDDSSFIMGYPQQGYSHNMNEPYPFNPEQLQQLARYDMNQQHSQVKADYSFDHQPPVLSSTSDSGASIQSAMSSNMGSPSAQPQQVNDWNQHFSMGPSIFPQDNIATSMFESGTIPGEAKIGCVGELSKVSSSHDFSFLQSSARDMTGETWSEDQAGTTDTTAHATYQMGSAFTPMDAGYQTYGAVPTGVPNDLSFQFPDSPASSGQPFQPRSPVLERVKGRRQVPAVSSPKRIPGTTRLARSSSASGGTERLYALQSPAQSPFFSQSSGHFVPPLWSSCPYSFFNFLFSLHNHGGGKMSTH
jgi:hypothetical protein